MSKYNSSLVQNLDLVDTGQCEVDITTVHMCSYIFTPSVKDYEAPPSQFEPTFELEIN